MRSESLVRSSHLRLTILAALLMTAPLACGPIGSPNGDTTANDAGTVPEGTDAGSDAGPTDAGPGPTDAGPGPTDAGPGPTDAGPGPTDAGPGPTDAGNTSGCGGSTPVALTVKNALVWCTVTVAGGTPSAAAEQTVCVGEDATVSLSATANQGFVLGDWHGTTGDQGSGDPGTVTGSGTAAVTAATVDATGTSACVWICCPGASGYEPCPTQNQCP